MLAVGSRGNVLALTASARSIEMFAISWVCFFVCSRLSMIKRRSASVLLEIFDSLSALRQRFHSFSRSSEVSNILFANGMSFVRIA